MKPRNDCVRLLSHSLLGFALSAATIGWAEPLEFNRDIRPILSENCFRCHGPDARKREAGLRLDQESPAKQPLESGATAIVPGDSASSALIQRVLSADADQKMPPVNSGKTLTAREIDLLKRWIDEGATWEGHWSLSPIKRPPPPRLYEPGLSKNLVDAFVLEKLQEAKLSHAPEADRATLIRRLSLDLTGIAPLPEEVDQFVQDQDAEAYEHLVDRLLASPRFGERMAMIWLDLVRYADSVGYHGDQPVSVSPFRDYVIHAFNQNKRFDQFTREQLAGDLLPQPSTEQLVAAGYNRLGMMSAEGGAQDKEYLAKYASERIRNLSGAWLGVTLGCCECHDHKFDPFTSREFYQLQAFFADVTEKGFYPAANENGNWGPDMQVPTIEQAAELARRDSDIAQLRQEIDRDRPELVAAQTAWERSQQRPEVWLALRPLTAGSANGATLTVLDDNSVLASGENPDKDVYTLVAIVPAGAATGIRLELLPHDSLPQKSCGRADNGNCVLTEFSVAIAAEGEMQDQPLTLSNATASFEQTLVTSPDDRVRWSVAGAIDGDARGAERGWAVMDQQTRWNHAVFEMPPGLLLPGATRLKFTLRQELGSRHTIGRFRLAISASPQPLRAFGIGLPGEVRDALAIAAERRTDEQRATLANYYRTIDPALIPLYERLAALQKSREDFSRAITTMLATVPREPRMIRVLPRGNWMDDSGDVVLPAVPAALPQPPVVDRRLTRLDLANWVASPENPLTARVFVNRLWKQFFGAGLAKKLEDVGAQGEWPSHPQLIDFLAGQFIDSGWDIKKTIRLMVTSGVYRQSSIPSAEARERDPFNRLLSRQGRFRLDAELVRDNALAISGLLVERVGGPSVKPYQPRGYWAHLNFPMREWENSQGDALYRRGLYTHWQRQYLHPSLMAFDAPSREECTADRVRSNTPLQALALLNDPAYVEASRVFAENMLRHGGATTDDRLRWAARRALGRDIRPAESQLLSKLVERHLLEFGQDPQAASSLIAIGERPVADGVDKVELAAWSSVARALLNLHETITRN